MSRSCNSCGPIDFRYSRAARTPNDKIGTKPTKCDVPGCAKPAPWNATALGWNIGTYCTAHKVEMLVTTSAILSPVAVEVAA